MSWILNDPPPKYGEELAECNRYYRKIKEITGYAYAQFGIGVASSASRAYVHIPLPKEMRGRPTLTAAGNFALWDGVSSFPATVNSILSYVPGSFAVLSVDVISGLVAKSPYMLIANGDSNAYLSFDSGL